MRRRFAFGSFSMLFLLSGCMHTSTQTWEDFKTLGRYMHREVDSLFGKEYESRLLASNDEFLSPDGGEFIPLNASDLRGLQWQKDPMLPQPKGIPGQNGVPALSEFYVPTDASKTYFQAVHFETDDYIAKDQHDLTALRKIASYLKENPNIYLFVEGHCDERASATYNMSLGLRRANFIRSFLVKQGISEERIYTASRGKEQPIALGHRPEDWKVNRRSEFKIYAK
ncbi:MAG: OmpA family protein [Verrucomicrobiota bacterium]|nr:OmpA family protein [Verrucomicrobiota bacterium]